MVSHPTDPDVYWTAGREYTGSQYVIQASRTDNAGSNWTRYILGSGSGDAYHMAIDPSDPQRVYVAGYENSSAALYRSDNGGSNWSGPSASGLGGYVYKLAIDPVDPSILYAATSQGVYRSTDYGDSWSQVRSGGAAAVCVDPDDHTTVYAGTSGSGIYASWDSGSSWEEFNEGLTETAISCLADVPGQYLFAGTEGSASFRWGGTGTTEEQEALTPSPFGLRVFPNPCRGTASIAYSIQQRQAVTLSVYDCTGRLVSTVRRGTGSPGSHTETWSAEGLQPGMYMVLLRGESSSETAKLTLTD